MDPSDPSVQSFDFTNSIKRVLGGAGTSMAAFETCALAKVAVNIGSAAIDALGVAACIAGVLGAAVTFGVSAGLGCGALIANTVVGVVTSVAIGPAVEADENILFNESGEMEPYYVLMLSDIYYADVRNRNYTV